MPTRHRVLFSELVNKVVDKGHRGRGPQHYNVSMTPVTGLRMECAKSGKDATFNFHLGNA